MPGRCQPVCQKYAMIFLTAMNTIANKILARAKRHGAGCVFSAKHLSDLGDRAAIDQALSRLAKERRHSSFGPWALRLAENPPRTRSAFAESGRRGDCRCRAGRPPSSDFAGTRRQRVWAFLPGAGKDGVFDRRQFATHQDREAGGLSEARGSAGPARRRHPSRCRTSGIESNWQRSRKRRYCTATPFHPPARRQTRPAQVDAPSSAMDGAGNRRNHRIDE